MTVKPGKLKLGTRGSPLALRQAEIVCAELARVQPDLEIETVIIKTSGDWTPAQGERPLDARGGGKALFAKELQEALLEDRIDAAVHSMKDMDSSPPPGLAITCMLPREDVRDAVILRAGSPSAASLDDLPQGAKIGTCSLRRQGMLLAVRPDLNVVPIRGNVGTRIEKMEGQKLAGILLAKAGLNRLKMAKKADFMLPFDVMLPAAGQGAIGIETKENSADIIAIFSQIKHEKTFFEVECERAALAALGGGCHTPVGSYAVLENNNLWLRMKLASPDGTKIYIEEGRSAASDGRALGAEIGTKLREKAPKELIY
ncbi:MAG: hydroxymethylbilane synthase [Alphaproteobacteria bacterium PRO2]|nr:hydroxymethylbilane synthase [Alphaproteobacteria bacterium PRO2]